MADDFADKYQWLLPKDKVPVVRAATWGHDLIEDCRLTYNDVKKELGEEVAEIVFAVTNEKGKTRAERANKIYYDYILYVEYARFVKYCDRLANVKYSVEKGSDMVKKYRNEQWSFKKGLYSAGNPYTKMVEEIDEMLR